LFLSLFCIKVPLNLFQLSMRTAAHKPAHVQEMLKVTLMIKVYICVQLPACMSAAGTPTLVALLHAVIKSPELPLLEPGDMHRRYAIRTLSSLPWARDISADALDPLLRELVGRKITGVGGLLELPGAKQLGVDFGLELLAQAVQAGLSRASQQLARWVAISRNILQSLSWGKGLVCQSAVLGEMLAWLVSHRAGQPQFQAEVLADRQASCKAVACLWIFLWLSGCRRCT
jgi:hypothetical protein